MEKSLGKGGEDAYLKALLFLQDLPREEQERYRQNPDELYSQLKLGGRLPGRFQDVKRGINRALEAIDKEPPHELL